MIYRVKTKDLKLGMYVILDQGWMHHPFLQNSFLLSSEKNLRKLLQSGIEEIAVDSARSKASLDILSITHPPFNISPPETWEPEKNISDELKQAIKDENLSPEKKAHSVYHHSIRLMNELFTNPSAEVIGASKAAIKDIVDLIVSDDETALHLLKITSHDFYTYTHSVNVGVLSISLAKSLFDRDSSHDLYELGAGFFLHDLGKVSVDSKIINKPAKLTEEEMKKMRIHPYQSYKILKEVNQLSDESKVIAMQHHEREDGTGYPRRLSGDDIHLYARICCIADVFDALTADRSYKKALSPFDALTVMKEQLIGHFHPELFENFVMMFAKTSGGG